MNEVSTRMRVLVNPCHGACAVGTYILKGHTGAYFKRAIIRNKAFNLLFGPVWGWGYIRLETLLWEPPGVGGYSIGVITLAAWMFWQMANWNPTHSISNTLPVKKRIGDTTERWEVMPNERLYPCCVMARLWAIFRLCKCGHTSG